MFPKLSIIKHLSPSPSANPRGFCAGVDRAIEITNRALDVFGSPIYVKHEIVHNKYVVDELKEKGVIFIEDINKVPEYSILIYSAHGVSEKIVQESSDRNLQVFNATCPLVTKVHMEVARLSKKQINTILVGHFMMVRHMLMATYILDTR